VLAAVRRSGVPIQRVRPALEVLSKDLGVDHALASRRLYSDGYARLFRLPGYRDAEVVADLVRSFGQPIFSHGGAKLTDVLERFWAGDDLGTLVEEFGVPRSELEDVVRVASRRAA
jgi:hypothetical protein